MARFIKNMDTVLGNPPGSLVFLGKQRVENIKISTIEYDVENVREYIDDINLDFNSQQRGVKWINVDGIHDTEEVSRIGKAFNLSPLVLEDILNTSQRPKLEELDESVFISLKMLYFSEDKRTVTAEQMSMVFGNNFVLTFQERPGDVFGSVRLRIRKGRGRIRKMGEDYLAYSLLDAIFENYIRMIEFIGEQIESLEEHVLVADDPDVLEKISYYRRELRYIRKVVRPAREIVSSFLRLDDDYVSDEIKPFLRDLAELSDQAMEAVEVYREMLSDYLGIYNSAVSNRLNEVMKVLTVFSTIFIPVTFLAGVYGMNFDFIPELKLQYAYPLFWVVVVCVVLVMLKFYRNKKWI
ncbi:magnesium/cobalt transporter CorA [Maridesulfovibrio bastinii]|uniref:magnesium/cobalt transporter CorA n=1 Tax=Maridesulfovibrio bastinii TaxID=47157 RepID=UPI0003F553C3|nr:magnesium/cobalt transporter CorA [Maridesulfovibrio bastinii]